MNYTKEDIEYYLINKEYHELNADELGFISSEVKSEKEFNQLKKLMISLVEDKSNETIIEPNILIHYHDCINNPNKYLNIGAGRTKNIKNAKHKLRPCKMLKINRKVSDIKLSKKEWFILKENII